MIFEAAERNSGKRERERIAIYLRYSGDFEDGYETQSKYLGLILDKRLAWFPHIHSKN